MDPTFLSEHLDTIVTIVGAGVLSWAGVRVALAEIRGDIKRHDQLIAAQDKRLDRLEDRVLEPRSP